MKVLILAFITVTVISVKFQSENITTTAIYQSNFLDMLDPSRPKLA